MSLTIIDKPAVTRRFLTYDMEWIPGEELYQTCAACDGAGCGRCEGNGYQVHKHRTDPLAARMVGVYDGENYRRYRTVDEFLNGELTSANRGKWFYAHAGGLADMGFVLERLIEAVGQSDAYKVEASFSGSSAIIVKVVRGHNAWHFVDSYWLFRDKLDNIAKFIGRGGEGHEEKRKTKAEAREFFSKATFAELAEKNVRDCEVLWTAINMFETALLELGGQLMMTIASCGLQLFRRKYLKGAIETSQSINARAELAYCSSRVEVFAATCGRAYKWDLNSSFPFAMTQPVPGDCTGLRRSLPEMGRGALFLADVDVTVPDGYLPPLPYRCQGRVFFPTGSWSGWYTSVDLELLLREGGRIERVREVATFDARDDLAMYATDLYARRKASTDTFERVVYKYLLNCLYGKFGESPYKSQIVVNPDVIDLVGDPLNGVPPMEMLLPGVWRQDLKVPVEHAHVPISATIVARARTTLYDGLSMCDAIFYTDTDSNITTTNLESSNELGAWKLEDEIVEGRFAAPKVYGYTNTKGEKVHHAKGFSDMDGARFDLVISGQKVPYQRMARLRELYGGKTTAPVEVLVEKALKGLALPKRCMYPDGQTRPWHVKELEGVR